MVGEMIHWRTGVFGGAQRPNSGGILKVGLGQRLVSKHVSRKSLLMPDAMSLHNHVLPKELQDLLTSQGKRRAVCKKAEQNADPLGPLSMGRLPLPFQPATCISFPLRHPPEA